MNAPINFQNKAKFKVSDFIKNKSVLISLYLLGLVIAIFVFTGTSRYYFDQQSKNAFAPLDSAYQANRSILKNHSKLESASSTLLLKKVELLELKKNHHRYIFTELYKSYYATVSILPFLSGILVIVSFLIAQTGWGNCSVHLKAIFFLFAFFSSIYGLYPTVYRHVETINDNINTYVQYSKVQKQIFDYSTTKPRLYGDSLASFNTFLDKINKEEQLLDGIYFGLELKSLDNSILNELNEN